MITQYKSHELGYKLWIIMFASSIMSGIYLYRDTITIRPENIMLLIFLGSVISLILILNLKIKMHYYFYFVTLFLCQNWLVSTYRSEVISDSLKGLITLSSNLLVFLLIICVFNFSKETLFRITFIAFGLFGFMEAAYGIIAYLTYLNLNIDIGGLMHGQQGFSVSVKGTFDEANIYATYISIALLIVIANFLSGMYKRYNVVLLISILVLLGALILSWTRSAWIGTFIGSVFIAWTYRKRLFNLKTFLILILILIILYSGVGAISKSFDSLSGSEGLFLTKITDLFNPKSATAVSRINEYSFALEQWSHNPFLGNGYFSFKEFGERVWISNIIIIILNDSGLIGALLFFIPIIMTFLECIKIYAFSRKNKDEKFHNYITGIIAGFISLIFICNFTPIHTLLFFWMYLSLMILYVKYYKKKIKKS
ncbi:O-antigen ligase family protein [Bacillus cereus group sp. Bc222]|uniref:O-antigen ligase family protein n=1 Tax=Bacillus cereus group TaxID=86661 RepID=UPI000941EDE0|nr:MULTISPECIES: O-antigen ligase family protein [unclassified Bacillus cereus group]MCM0005845.1 O-antigen ligase family protein [Bacillus paranthracis]MDA1957521.1 O-antigen ligase family protein [Bacillus cereus group sp. BcHK114]MDA2240402.1 O-antigen ligase family protein [Bacillus cereus group sp. Bc222]MDA2585484.1 O-antigen ligase family protein [Bacillus cereus group sp. Bc062]MDX5867660.1 O-antigen ligase family protein [Bacillus cereus group sp. BfR-BA-01119]